MSVRIDAFFFYSACSFYVSGCSALLFDGGLRYGQRAEAPRRPERPGVNVMKLVSIHWRLKKLAGLLVSGQLF